MDMIEALRRLDALAVEHAELLSRRRVLGEEFTRQSGVLEQRLTALTGERQVLLESLARRAALDAAADAPASPERRDDADASEGELVEKPEPSIDAAAAPVPGDELAALRAEKARLEAELEQARRAPEVAEQIAARRRAAAAARMPQEAVLDRAERDGAASRWGPGR